MGANHDAGAAMSNDVKQRTHEHLPGTDANANAINYKRKWANTNRTTHASTSSTPTPSSTTNGPTPARIPATSNEGHTYPGADAGVINHMHEQANTMKRQQVNRTTRQHATPTPPAANGADAHQQHQMKNMRAPTLAPMPLITSTNRSTLRTKSNEQHASTSTTPMP